MQGSIVNRVMEAQRYPEITVGMGATVCMHSDRSPYTVVAVRRGPDGAVREIDIRGDHVSANLDTWPAQRYDITPATVEEDTPVQTWRMDRAGRLRRTYVSPDTGRRVMASKNSDGLSLGDRDYYRDPSF